MSPSSKPSVPLSKVPSVKELCEQLGFQYASLKDTNRFMEVTRAWRKSYQTTSGRLAADLRSWNEPSDQLDLEEMAQKFIDDRGNGERFWSPSRSWNHDSDLQFPEDRARIVALLKQLFWKQNRYAFNNSHYGHKGTETRDGSREKTTPVRQFGPAVQDASPAQVASAQAEPDNARLKAKLSPRNPTRPATHDETNHQPPAVNKSSDTRGPDTTYDIFDIPDSDHDDVTIIQHSLKRPLPNHSPGNSPQKKKKLHPADSPRRTDRKRTARSVPHTVPSDQLEQLLSEQVEVPDRTQDTPRSEGSLPKDSSAQTTPRSSAMNAEAASKDPLRVSPTTRPFAAPTAPMDISNIHKSATPPSNASKGARATVRSDQNKSSSPPSSRNSPTSTAKKSKTRELVPQSFAEAVEESSATAGNRSRSNETAISRASLVSPSTQSTLETEGHLRLISAVPKAAHTTNTSSVAGRPGPNGHPRIPPDQNLPSESDETDKEVKEKATPNPQVYTSNSDHLQHYQAGIQIENSPSLTAQSSRKPIPSVFPDFPGYTHEIQKRQSEYLSTPKQPVPQTDMVENTPKIPTPAPGTRPPPEQIPPRTEPSRRSPPPPQASSSKPRQKTQIPLWIITREPRYTEERWDEGKFTGTALQTFIEGISKVTQRSHIEKIKLTLRAPIGDTKITVFKDAEDSWASARETFVEKLKEAKAAARTNRQLEPVSFKILVEPFYEEGSLPTGTIDEDDEEFDF